MNISHKDMGLTEEEYEVLKKLGKCHKAFLDLERQHPSEMIEFTYAVHLIQDLIAIRAVRRSFPKGWPSYEVNEENENNLNFHSNTLYKLLKQNNIKLDKIEEELKNIKDEIKEPPIEAFPSIY